MSRFTSCLNSLQQVSVGRLGVIAFILSLVVQVPVCAQLGQSDWQTPSAPSGSHQQSGIGQSDWQQPAQQQQLGQSDWQQPQRQQQQLGQSDWQQPQRQQQQLGQSDWQQPAQQQQLGQSDWQQPGRQQSGQSNWQQPAQQQQLGQSDWQQSGSAPNFEQNLPQSTSKPMLLGEVLDQEQQNNPNYDPTLNAAIVPQNQNPMMMNMAPAAPSMDPLTAVGTLMGNTPQQAQAQAQALTTLAPAVLNFMSNVMPPGGMRGGIGGFPAPGTGFAGGVGSRGYSTGYGGGYGSGYNTGYNIGANTVGRATNQAAAGLNAGLMRMMSNIGR